MSDQKSSDLEAGGKLKRKDYERELKRACTSSSSSSSNGWCTRA